MSAIVAPVQQNYPAPNRNQFAAEGSYLIATNPTVSTGVLWFIGGGPVGQQAFVDTGPNFWIHNNEANGGLTIYLDFIKLISTAVATATVSLQFAVIIDPIPRKITTNNMLNIIPVSATSTYPNATTPSILAQNSHTASVFSASSASSKIVAKGCIGGVNIAGHTYGVNFGALHANATAVGSTDTAAAPGQDWGGVAPVAISPGQDCSVYFWSPSSTVEMDPEFVIGMIARP